MQLVPTLAGIAWDPQIRGFLAVLVGVVVFMGSIYLLLATNTGNRLGFLLALTGFWGWMVIMGIIWWMYGIGMKGEDPSWVLRETNFDVVAAADADLRELDTSELPDDPAELYDLEPAEFEEAAAELEPTLGSDWVIVPESDPAFGEASAAVDAAIAESPLTGLEVDSADDYIITWVFERGGKDSLDDDPTRLERIELWLENTFLRWRHPPHYAVVQLQPVVPQEQVAGEPPPTPIPDESKPTISVLLERDLGDRRFPAAMITLGSAIMFGVLCNLLHRRDKLVSHARGLVPVSGG